MYKEIILSKIVDYIKLKKIDYKGTKCITLHCVLCNTPGCGANVIPNTAMIKCNDCKPERTYNLIDMARKIENLPDSSDEDILTMLRTQLNLNVITQKDESEIGKLLDKFEARKWALVPCAKPGVLGATSAPGKRLFLGKEPIQTNWQTIENRNKAEWFHWLNSGLNIGVRTGAVSNLCIIDFDFYTKAEKAEIINPITSVTRQGELRAKKLIPADIKALLGETLIQETLGGFHVFYQANDLPKGDTNIQGIHIDIEAEGGQVIIAPSVKVGVEEEYKEGEEIRKRIIGYGTRKFINDNPILPMPQAIYDLLKNSKVKPPQKPKSELDHEEIAKAVASEDFKIKDLTNNRKNTLIKLGGIFQKKMNIGQVSNVLEVLNMHLLTEPLPKSDLQDVVVSLEKYVDSNETELKQSILDYLTDTDVATKTEIEHVIFGQRATSEQKRRLDRILANLLIDRKIVKYNSRNYKICKDMQWSGNLLQVGTPIDFKMPYFDDFAYFNWGDIILIGSQTKYGKTTLAMNFVKRLIQQGRKPGYIYNESGGRFAKTALKLGIRPDEFQFTRAINPLEVILKPNGIYIYDWIRPTDFARTADLFDSLVGKLEESHSIMVGFVQLRDKDEWFAKDLIRQFVALSAKYIYLDEHGVNTKLELADVRDRKSSGKAFQIPCQYVEETREVRTVEEIEEEQRAIAEREAKAKAEVKNDKRN